MALLDDLQDRMNKTLDAYNKELAGLRTGRASIHLVDGVTVEAYGSEMPLNQVCSIGVPESRLITLQVWDKSMVGAVEKAINNANLGLNPATDGQLIRLPMPDLTEERRKDLTKIAAKYAEQARVAIRNIRRDGMDEIKQQEKNSDISEDEMHAEGENIQSLTDDYIGKIDDALKAKEQEIMTV